MVYDNVKARCRELGIPIMECEKRAGLSNGVIGGWRNGNPRLSSLIKVADALGVDVADLVRDEEHHSKTGITADGNE